MSTTLISGFIEQAKQYPQRAALWSEGRYYTYGELYAAAVKLAVSMVTHKAKRCAIFSQRNYTAYVGVIAALLAAKTYVPFNPDMPFEHNVALLEQADVGIMVVDQKSRGQAKDLLSHCEKSLLMLLPDQNDLLVCCDQLRQSHFVGKQDNPDAYLLFTSGSTGAAKGVMVSHINALSYVHSSIQRYQPTANDRFSQITKLTFDLSVHDLFVCWSVGACLYSFVEKDFLQLIKFIRKHVITFWLSVPSTILLLQQLPQIATTVLPDLRCSLFCGEPLSQRLAAFWHRLAPNSIIENCYGPTEATVAITSYRWQADVENKYEMVPIGKPFSDQLIKILDEQLSEVRPGKTGELCLSGSQVVKGYWCNEPLTKERFVLLNNKYWYRTGDVVLWDEAEGLIYQGRVDDQIKIKGCRVEKLAVEIALRSIAETESVAIVAWPINADGLVQGLVAFISNTHLSSIDVYKKCREQLPDYIVPHEIIFLDHLPLNNNGKVNYHALKNILNNK